MRLINNHINSIYKLKVIFIHFKMSSEYVENIKIPSTIPIMKYRYQTNGGGNKNRPLLVQYSSGPEINIKYLNHLKDNIINTKMKYVHPIVFVGFAKQFTNKNDIRFEEHKLFKLRIWSNQLRDCYDAHELDKVNYLTYIIGSKIIKYLNTY